MGMLEYFSNFNVFKKKYVLVVEGHFLICKSFKSNMKTTISQDVYLATVLGQPTFIKYCRSGALINGNVCSHSSES